MKRSGFLKRKTPLKRSSGKTDAQKQWAAEQKAWKQAQREKYGAPEQKFNNVPVWFDGIHFPSKLQCGHYQEYRLLEKAKEIAEYDYEVDIPLYVNKILIGNIRVDHKYYDLKHECHVIGETKSEATKTPLWVWKWNHLKAQHPEFIYEVRTGHKIQREYPKKDLTIYDFER